MTRLFRGSESTQIAVFKNLDFKEILSNIVSYFLMKYKTKNNCYGIPKYLPK